MNIRSGVRSVSGIPVIWTHGEVNNEAVPVIQKHIDKLLAAGQKKMIIDMSKAVYVDTDGLKLLKDTHQTCVENGGKMDVVCKKNSKVSSTINLVRLDQVFGVQYRLEDAVQSIKTF